MEHPPHTRGHVARVNVLFAVLQCFFWSAHCIYYSFLVMYLNSKHYSHKTIGFLMMLLAILGTFVPAIAGYLADFCIPIKKIVSGCLLVSIPAGFLLPLSVSIVPLAFLSVCCMGVLEKNLSSVIDSWAMRIQQKKPYLNYGLTRGCASLSYAVVGLVFGNVFRSVGLDAMFGVHAVFAGVALLAALLLDAIPVQHAAPAKGERASAGSTSYWQVVRELWHNKRYRLLLFSMTCYGMSIVAIHTFQPLLITEIGGTSADLGKCLFVMAACEVPMMFLFQRLSRRVSSAKLLRLSFFCTILRILGCAFAPSIGWLIAVQPIHALSFGLYLPSMLKYVSDITHPKVKATSITLAVACCDGLAGVLANPVGGFISDTFGLRAVFFVLAFFALVGFSVFCISFRLPAASETAS